MRELYLPFYRYFLILNLFFIFLQENIAFTQVSSKYDIIDSSIENFMLKNKIPGFIACVIKDSSMIWSKSYGKSDLQNNVPISIEGIMNIGSISKTFTATAVMQLWEKGMIKLDSDVSEYLDIEIKNPEFPEQPITIFQILTHTSSICDGTEYGRSYSCGDPIISLKDWIQNYLIPGGKFYRDENFGSWSPGTKQSYSNVAFGLLGLIIEQVSKQPFNEYCMDNIFIPLGMNNTGWHLSEIDKSKHIKPYVYASEKNENYIKSRKYILSDSVEFSNGQMLEFCLYSFPNYPDGLVRTSVRELSYYLMAIMNDGEYNGSKILNKKTIDKMLSPQLEIDNSQGLCWYTFEFDSSWGHTGGDPGIATSIMLNPTNKIGIITFQNNSDNGQMQIIKNLYQIALDE